MKTTKLIPKILLAAIAVSISLPPVLAQENPPPFKSPFKSSDGDDDWFMEETTQKKPKQVRPVKIPDSQANNLGVPMTEDGRIIPLKDDGTPIMTPGSTIQVTNDYLYQPGAYYPGIPQFNTPYMGGLNPYMTPGMVPYGGYNPGGVNINLGRAGGISIGGGGGFLNPYPYTYGTNTSTITPLFGSQLSPYSGAQFINQPYGYAPGMAVPNYGGGGMIVPGYGVPGMGGIGLPGMGGIGRPGRL